MRNIGDKLGVIFSFKLGVLSLLNESCFKLADITLQVSKISVRGGKLGESTVFDEFVYALCQSTGFPFVYDMKCKQYHTKHGHNNESDNEKNIFHRLFLPSVTGTTNSCDMVSTYLVTKAADVYRKSVIVNKVAVAVPYALQK